MHTTPTLVMGAGLAMLVAATVGCGGTAAEDASSFAQKTGSISATPAVYGGNTTITLYPGRFADDAMTVELRCYQGGELVLANGSYELHYAIEHGIDGYSLCAPGDGCQPAIDGLGDHYQIVEGPLSSQTYTGGAAECTVSARHYSKRPADFATGTFSIAPGP